MAEGLRLVWTIFLRLTRENLQILATLMVLSSKLEKKIYQTPIGLRASSLDLLYYKLRGAVFRCEISKFVACKLYAAPLPCLVFFHQTITLLPDYTISTILIEYVDQGLELRLLAALAGGGAADRHGSESNQVRVLLPFSQRYKKELFGLPSVLGHAGSMIQLGNPLRPN